MRPLLRFWQRRTVMLTLAATAALLLVPAVAMAVDDDAPAPAGPMEHPVGEGPTLQVAPAAASCEPILVSFSREGVSGQDRAVALTAQSIDVDTDGWVMLAWEAAEGTHLTAVSATGTDGTTRALDPASTGTVHDVASLTFCGTHTGPGPTPDPSAEGAPDSNEDTTADDQPADDQPADDQPADEPANRPTAAPASCDDLLVTFARDGVTGDDHSVSLTAQSIDEDADGWVMLAWEAAEGTHLTAVSATGTDGTTRALDPTDTGTVHDVASLAFCGTASSGPERTAAEVVVEVVVEEPPGTPDGDAIATREPDADPAPTARRAPATRSAGPAAGTGADAGDDGEEEADVEVLGVQLVAPIEPSEPDPAEESPMPEPPDQGGRTVPVALAGSDDPRSGLHPLLFAAAIAAGIAGGGSVLRARRGLATTTSTDAAEAGR